MRVRARKDANHKELFNVFKDLGASVIDLSQLGSGIPDLLVVTGKRYCLVEVKDGSKPPSAQKLTKDEEIFHSTFNGDVRVINSVAGAVGLINEMRKA